MSQIDLNELNSSTAIIKKNLEDITSDSLQFKLKTFYDITMKTLLGVTIDENMSESEGMVGGGVDESEKESSENLDINAGEIEKVNEISVVDDSEPVDDESEEPMSKTESKEVSDIPQPEESVEE
jgi:hypothetical protein